jgi:hypothetical protein
MEPYIMKIIDPRKCWHTLKSSYGAKQNAKWFMVYNKFPHFYMEEATYVGVFCNKYKDY